MPLENIDLHRMGAQPVGWGAGATKPIRCIVFPHPLAGPCGRGLDTGCGAWGAIKHWKFESGTLVTNDLFSH